MKNSPLLDKSLEFAAMIVLFYDEYSKSKKDTTISKQLLRSGTSVGANLNEAIYGNSKADFMQMLDITVQIKQQLFNALINCTTSNFLFSYKQKPKGFKIVK